MTLTARKLLTVVTEAALEKQVVAELEGLGARGYTVTDARGSGTRGRRQSTWDQGGNVRIEVICDADFAEATARLLRDRYYDNYAMIVFVQDVAVLRPEKFRRAEP